MIPALINTLKEKVFKSNLARSSGWTIGSVVLTQGLRLISNLILTRMLVPEFFGIMALVQSTLVIVGMLTDIGLSGAVYNTKRAYEEAFMKTAWTIQVIQGCSFAFILVCASYPLSLVYDQPALTLLLIVAASTIALDSTRSTAILLADKNLNQKPRFISELIALVSSAVVMISLAYWTQSYWALMAGHSTNTILRWFLSYRIYPAPHIIGLRLEKEAVKEILTYGRWVFLSSLFYVLLTQADVMIMGLWMPIDELGLYSIATVFASIVTMLTTMLAARVLHPYYNKLISDSSVTPEGVRSIRLKLHAAFITLALIISALGEVIIRVLYDDRYLNAGWMLQLLAFGRVASVLSSTLIPFILAKGDSFKSMTFQGVLAAFIILGLVLGGHYYGVVGLIMAYAFIPLLGHFILLAMVSTYQLRIFWFDSLTIVGCFLIMAGVWYFSGAKFIFQFADLR